MNKANFISSVLIDGDFGVFCRGAKENGESNRCSANRPSVEMTFSPIREKEFLEVIRVTRGQCK